MIIYIHANKSEVHFADGDIKLDIPFWLDTVKYTVSRVLCRSAVPLYFMISSVLLYKGKANWVYNIKNKAKRLLIPYFILNIAWILLFFVFQHISFTNNLFSSQEFMVSDWGVYEWFDAFLGMSDYPMVYHLWFLRDLFFLNVLAPLFKAIIDRCPRIALFVVCLFWLTGFPTGIFFLSREALVFWTLGYYIVKYDFHISDLEKIKKSVIGLIYIVLVFMDVLLRDNVIGEYIHYVAIAFGCVFWIVYLSSLYTCSGLKNKIFMLSGYSFFIYLIHEYILKTSIKIGAKFLPNNSISQVLQFFFVPLAVFFACWGLGLLVHRLFPRLYGLLSGVNVKHA